MRIKPVVAEFVGPSGAGKSTLSSCVNSGSPDISAGLTIWNMPTRELALSAARSLPDLLTHGIERKRFNKEELKQIIRLDAFYRMVKRCGDGPRPDAALFFDEGVVFALTKLRADMRAGSRGSRMHRWEERVLDRWSS